MDNSKQTATAGAGQNPEAGEKSGIKRWLLKPGVAGMITVLLIAGTVWAGYSLLRDDNGKNAPAREPEPAPVTIAVLETDEQGLGRIRAVGKVTAESRIDVPAMANGTVQNILFEIGDRVSANSTLARLYDSATQANLMNAQTHVDNMRANLLSAERLAEENILQARIGVESAQEAIRSAQIALETARDNLENARSLQQKSNQDTLQNAVVSFDNYTNTVYSALEQTDYLLGVEDDDRLPGIALVLGVKDLSSVDKARRSYQAVKNDYEELNATEVTTNNITELMREKTALLQKTLTMTNDMISVLEATITGSRFPAAALEQQKSSFLSLRSTVVNMSQNAQATLNQLENLDLSYEQNIDQLENAVRSAEAQVQSTRTQKKNAEARLESARKSKEQQIISARSSLNNAQGQLRLAQIQAGDLAVKSPISGRVTQKYAELGSKVSVGQPIAEISQTDMLLIEVEVSPDEVKRLRQGQSVTLVSGQDSYSGTLNRIYPSAGEQNRKVKAEIVFDNTGRDLIPGSFVDVVLPLEAPESAKAGSIFIPLESVFITPSGNYVFLAEESRAVKQEVELGQTSGNQIEVTAGLSAGDKLIVKGSKNLKEGENIKITN
jgi:RND family efflux transporter MFP subunit